ncbi:hypothetical protein AKJ47_01940 [candidate division MSBL1 archaeon SCGC-AAA261G05]|uniref:PDZ domain-containing protein n=2 Tax=candidate division MSBL1 TaxID=215777 RepID=A0A133VAZ2_9EURY|nr:hypothetical protein AKJ47_01940 [candidate division MSBL1 archaeon SCGC-AAA261G05]KXB04564.1 hypothetical protein AKJ48_02185 [candidate division MSBL1 archaeon SCGC-AAA261O19]
MTRLGNGEDGTSSVSESKFQRLKRRVDSLENGSMNEPRTVNATENLWSVDEIYRLVENSVVEIRVTKSSEGFFETEQTGLGSGFVYDKSGHVITNQHVVEGADEVLVRFYNGETVKAKVIGSDSYSDLAVIKVDTSELDCRLDPVSLGDSSVLETGDPIVTVGNPYGLEGTTTFGIVSQTGRVLSSETRYLIPGVIQIDAPINSGNSGGPLLNMAGRVVGVTTAIQSETGTFSGIGYAVPSDLMNRVVESLIEEGEYSYAWLGISGQKVTYETAQRRGLERTRGFLVKNVSQDGPSSDRVMENDVILRIDGREVMGVGDILSYIGVEKAPGEDVSLKVLRDGEETVVTVKLGVRPSP